MDINTILGTKLEMGQKFVQGERMAVTNVSVDPCMVTHIKTLEKDGYWAVQVGFGKKKIKNVTNPEKGHLKKTIKGKKFAPLFLREIKLDQEPKLKVGDEIKASDIFNSGDIVNVTGVGKGKGFAGVIKRWGFAGGPRTHGQSDRERAPGSIGQGTTIGRVFKGKKMPGRMGTKTKTIRGVRIVSVDEKENNLVLTGPVPGNRGGLLTIKRIKSGGPLVKAEKVVEKGKKQKKAEEAALKEESKEK